mmetsp:Transcript_12074/g.28360  ORF Transcript_12074/g.28360 Transcript_12074/m.28360 type:complete len:362 (+) Transcript_12074:69-1154(+)|eukprot:CAMPEP_0171095662 /NCGR_PEP_ID=MMETSP0766_2-20121228/43300_1 /TAXON_ID=439317 /ORGANISM="Gambierdiscus australes, Strain CAWD 149" /LENGTH=361 /DNA_ID=CAMNT_0011554505 /DNA_START=68 /DNA_END=1153 /DNA_ORIENTATION=+
MTFAGDKAERELLSDGEYDDAQSISDDDLDDTEVEAFAYMQIAYSLARNAVKSCLNTEAEKDEQKLRHPVAAQLPMSATAAIDPKLPQQVLAPLEGTLDCVSRRDSMRRRRRIIGGVRRAPIQPQRPLEAIPAPHRMDIDDTLSEDLDSCQKRTHQRPSSITNTYRALGVEFYHMDDGDQQMGPATCKAEGSWFTKADRPDCGALSARTPSTSSQAYRYEVTRPSVLELDLGKSIAAKARRAPASGAGLWVCRTPRGSPSTLVVEQVNAEARAVSAMALDLGDVGQTPASKVCRPPPTPPPPNASRSRSAVGYRVVKAKQSSDGGLLPQLPASIAPSKPLEWTAGTVRPQRRWAANASPVF